MPADTVHLVSSEGESFDVTSSAASMSQLVRNLIDESGDDDEAQEIPLPNVKSTILALVIEFMNHYEILTPTRDISTISIIRFFNF